MRTLFTPLVVGILLFSTSSTLAESNRQAYDPTTIYNPQDFLPEIQGQMILKLSPLDLDIYQINEAAKETQRELLVRLAATQDEDELTKLVARLERLDTDRQLVVLKTRIRYARLESRYDLAFRLQNDILKLLEKEIASLM